MNSAQNATLQTPQTTGQLLKYIAKKIPGRLLKSLPVILIVGFSSWLIHTYLLVFVNEGFNPDSWLANNFLNVKGRFISSTLLWGMVGALVPMTISFFATGGNPVKSFTAMLKMPMDIYKKNKVSQNALLPIILISCGITLLFDKLLSGVAGLVAGGILMSAVVSFATGRGSIFIMLFRMIFMDIQTYVLKKKNKGLDSESIYMIVGSSGLVLVIFGILKSTNIIGGIFNFIMRIMPFPFFNTILSIILWAIFFFIGSIWFIMLVAGIIMILIRSSKKVPTALVYIALFAFGMIAAEKIFGVRIFADDGGWLEAGGTWSGWIGSEGSFIAVIRGFPPAIAGIIGSIISSILSGAAGGIGGAAAGIGGAAAGAVTGGDNIPGEPSTFTPPSDETTGSTPVTQPDETKTPSDETPMTEEEKQKQHEEWVRQEREKAQREAEEAKRQHEELMEKRRQEYERAQKEAELRRQKEEAQKELDRIRKEREEREAYIQKLCTKYNTTPDKLRNEIVKNMNMSQAEADKWNQRANALAVAEAAAMATVVAADLLIDGMAAAGGPAGRAVRAGYKVTKGALSTAASDGLTMENLVGGAVSGGADAVTDFIDNKYVKAGVTVVGETVGGAIKGGSQGALDGLKNGVYNAGVNAITDKVVDKFGGKGFGNDVKTGAAPGGKVNVSVESSGYRGLDLKGGKFNTRTVSQNVADKFVTNKQTAQIMQTGVKSVPTVANEFVVKPLAQKKGYLPK